MKRRVIKIGGSLLSRDGLKQDFCAWLTDQPPAVNIVLVGGGQQVDRVRLEDARDRGNPADVHWRCVDLMRDSFTTVARLFSEWTRITTATDLAGFLNSGPPSPVPAIAATSAFYSRELNTDRLPQSWATTSDSIAALLAIETHADELIVVKSCEIPHARTISRLARDGIIDETLPGLVNEIPSVHIEKLANCQRKA